MRIKFVFYFLFTFTLFSLIGRCGSSQIVKASSSPYIPTGFTANTYVDAYYNPYVVLSWDSPSSWCSPAYYELYRSQSPGTEKPLANISYNGGVTTFTDINVIKGDTYYYVIYLVDCDGKSPVSNEISVIIPNISVSDEIYDWSGNVVYFIIAVGILIGIISLIDYRKSTITIRMKKFFRYYLYSAFIYCIYMLVITIV